MANTYVSKFKGAEVDEGVNIARNLAGTGGIDIRTFGTGINTVKKIDGSTLMTALGEKQDTLTVSSNIHINSLMADHAITLGDFSSGSISLYPQSGASGNVYFPKYGGYLATTGNVTSAINGQSFKTINGESIKGTGDISITAGITGVNIYSGGKRGTITNITFDSDIYNTPTVGGPTGGAQDWLIMPTPKTKTINGQSILGTGDITVGGGSAGVSSIGGKTGAITLGTGLAMSGQQLVNKVKVYTSGNYLCIDTN